MILVLWVPCSNHVWNNLEQFRTFWNMLEPPATQPCGARTASFGVCEDFTIANCEMSGFASVEPSRLDFSLYHYRCPPQAKIKFFSFFKGAGFNASRFLGMLFSFFRSLTYFFSFLNFVPLCSNWNVKHLPLFNSKTLKHSTSFISI